MEEALVVAPDTIRAHTQHRYNCPQANTALAMA